MHRFYLYPSQATGWRPPGAPASLALQLWLSPTTAAAQLRVIAARAIPIAVTVYDATGRVCYQAVALPNSTLPLEHLHWAIGAYSVQACQGVLTTTRMLMRV
jgi:hypothetical protein